MPSVDVIRDYCRTLPCATEHVQWGNDLVFKIAGKMFAVAALEPSAVWVSFKCAPETFAELTDRPGVIPAPYLARAYWVALESEDAVPRAELIRLLRQAYDLVVAKLPRKTRESLGIGPTSAARSRQP